MNNDLILKGIIASIKFEYPNITLEIEKEPWVSKFKINPQKTNEELLEYLKDKYKVNEQEK